MLRDVSSSIPGISPSIEGPTPLVIFEIQLKKKFFFLSITWGWVQ